MRSGSILVIFTFLFEAQSHEIGGIMTAGLRDCTYVTYPRSHSCLVVDLVTVPHFCSRFFCYSMAYYSHPLLFKVDGEKTRTKQVVLTQCRY